MSNYSLEQLQVQEQQSSTAAGFTIEYSKDEGCIASGILMFNNLYTIMTSCIYVVYVAP